MRSEQQPKSARRKAREFALQGLYQWQLAGAGVDQVRKELSEAPGYDRADAEYFKQLISGCIETAPELERLLTPYLDRRYAELTPIERSILLLGCYELVYRPEVPFRVVINEAVELAKSYGGTDAHKYVNGVLDKLASQTRAAETSARRAAP